jgi:hypothetical protein
MNTQQLWQSQALDAPRMSLTFVRHQLEAFRRRTRIRNVFYYIMGTLCIAVFAWKCAESFNAAPLLSAATALWILTALVGTVLERKHIATEEPPAELGVLDALKFHRHQLERQRDARRMWWHMVLFVPGFVMLFAHLFVEVTPIPWKDIMLNAVVIVCGIWIAIVLMERSARRVQKEIDALDSLRLDSGGVEPENQT